MDGEPVRFGLTAFVTLPVVIDPPGAAPTFVSLTEGTEAAERRAVGKTRRSGAPACRSGYHRTTMTRVGRSNSPLRR